MNLPGVFFFTLLAAFADAAEPTVLEKSHQAVEQTAKEISKAANETLDRRATHDYFILGNYSLADLIIPNKIGLTLGVIRQADKTWELEYLRGKISVPFLIKDLGEMSDERISLIGRSYFGSNSFNFSYGPSFFDFSVHLGNQILSRVSSGTYPSIDLLEIQALGFNIAIGNRWSFQKNITFGVDWISWSQPLIVIKKQSIFLDRANNPDDRDDVERAMNLISYFPRLALFKLQLGILF